MEPEKKNGATVGLIVIIIILVIGGVYLWWSNMKEEAVEQNANLESSEAVNNETTSIEAELDGVDLESLDSEI